jgi:putative flippase GtrA
MLNLMHFSALISNIVAWLASVIVAFLTNKPFVFRSYNWSLSVVVPEFVKFVNCRLLSGVLETAILWLTVDILSWNGTLWKLLTMVFVIVINYIGSKLFVFRKK